LVAPLISLMVSMIQDGEKLIAKAGDVVFVPKVSQEQTHMV
jgi:ethanolamine utilization protein EutQ (cupin superfamily)